MTTWTYTCRELCRRPGRTLLTVFGVAIGVAILFAVLTSTKAARQAYRDLFNCTDGKETIEVVAPGAGGFEAGCATLLEAVPGVQAVCPRVLATAAVVDGAGATPAIVVGLDPERAVAADKFMLHEGQPFADGDGVWVDARTAVAHGWLPGAPIRLWTPTGQQALPLLGTVTPRGPAGAGGAATLYMPLAVAQRLFAFPNQVNSIEIVLADGAGPEEVSVALSDQLPPGLVVQSSGRRGELSRSTLLVVEHGLTALGLIALVAAGFVVLNTVLLNLTERRQQLALLRSLGATTCQIRRLILREAVLLGVTGAIFGSALGVALAVALTHALEGFLGVELPPPQVSFLPIVIAMSAGLGLSVIATAAAITRASRRPPLEDLVGPRGACFAVGASRICLPSLGLAALATALAASLCLGWWPQAVAAKLLAPAIAAVLLGSALVLPLVLPNLLQVAGRLLRCLWRIEGQLAGCQLLRRPTRTSLTAGVLFIAIASAVGFGHFLVYSLDDLRCWCSRAIVADYLVRGSASDSSFLLATPLPEALTAEMAQLPGVDHVDTISFLPAKVNGKSALVLARTVHSDLPPALDLREGDAVAAWRGLLHGEAVLGTGLARRLGVATGDTVTLQTGRGPVKLRVAGVVTEYTAGGDALYLAWDVAKDLLGIPGVHAFLVSAKPDGGAAIAPALQQFCATHRLLLQSNADFRGLIEGLVARVEGALWVLVTLTFAVASLGVVNTLTMNILEQTRELSLLRALGMTGAQIRRVVVGQALLIGLVSLAPGAALGLGLAALLNWTANTVFAQQTTFAIHFPLTIGCFAVGLAITAVAALLPARHAARSSTRSV